MSLNTRLKYTFVGFIPIKIFMKMSRMKEENYLTIKTKNYILKSID